MRPESQGGQVLGKREPGGKGRGQVPRPPGREPPASLYLADEAVPVLAPHVRTGRDVDLELLAGAQRALGNVGEEGCSFPVRQHVFHEVCGEPGQAIQEPGEGGYEVQSLRC